MRIISGSKKGLRLKSPKTKDIRPTEDRIKESLFNILYNIDGDSLVLDLFAGTGSIGLEFLSRGANFVYFIDHSREGISTTKYNIDIAGFKDKSKLVKNDYLKAIRYLGRQDIRFNYIFMDPPYKKGLIEDGLKEIETSHILAEDGLIIVEHEIELDLEDRIGEFNKVDYRDYGTKAISFYRR